MTALASKGMQAAAIGFAAATAYTSTVAIRQDLPGEPLGIRIPLSVPAAVAVGWGSAVSAPWLMPLAALVAVTRPGPRAGLVCAVVGLAGTVGICLEPTVYRTTGWARATRRAALAHMATSGALAITGILHLRRAGHIQGVP